MKKILIISSFWTPRIHVATNRVVAYAKYLKEAGFEISVLTLINEDRTEDFAESIEQGLKIIRIKSKSFLNRSTFNYKDSYLSHKLKALKNKLLNQLVVDDNPGFYKAFKLNQKKLNLNDFDIVLSSFAPLSAHRIAFDLKSDNAKLQWIADFRDEMSFLPQLSERVRSKLRTYEKSILKKSDYVCSVSKPLLDQFNSLVKVGRYLEIRNGFDFQIETEPEHQRDIFRLTYAGTFHGAMNPYLFLEAMGLFKNAHPKVVFEIHFYSGSRSVFVPEILRQETKCLEKVDYEDLPAVLKQASVFFLVQAVSDRTGVYSGKTFDYLAVNRPILALVDQNDVAAQLINECRAGYICHHSKDLKAAQLAGVIEKIHQEWLAHKLPERNWDLIKDQSRKSQISKLISELKVSR